jgi:glycosyltransferase involved in cell wall biosynthesis
MVYWAALGSHPATVALKYLGQTLRTWWILLRDKPDAVFVMSPPVVAGLAVFPYCAIRRIPFVVDAHTGAFLNPRWRRFQWLQHWLCRRAATTIVTNTFLQRLLADHGGDATILPDVPVVYPDGPHTIEVSGFSVVVVCSFVYDEPVGIIIDAIRALPAIRFLLTGEHTNVPELQGELPPNLTLTGFLSARDYGQLLRAANVVMAFTTARHTMLRAAYEAIYQGTPVILTDSPLLRDEFPRGAEFVDNSAGGIAAAVRRMQADYDRYKQEALELKALKQRRWETNRQALLDKLERRPAAAPR